MVTKYRKKADEKQVSSKFTIMTGMPRRSASAGSSLAGRTILRWILKILHYPRYHIPWELWYYSIPRSCRTISINSSDEMPRSSPSCSEKALVSHEEVWFP